MQMMICFLFIIVSIKLLTVQSSCPPTRDYIQGRLSEVYIPGAAIIAVNRRDVLYQEGFGYYSPLETEQLRRSIDPASSIFMLASISKTFLVVAAMQLVEKNLLDLDVDINEYLPSDMNITHPHFSNATITVRHLLSHTSGMGTNYKLEFQSLMPGDSFTQVNLSDAIQYFLSFNESWLPIPPGNATFYSNVGVTLAAYIIERLSGQRFERYVHEKLLSVLNIDENKSGYRLSDFQNQEQNLVDHYVYNASWLEFYNQVVPQLNASQAGNSSNWLHIPFFGIKIYPAGALRMSAFTLSVWLRSFLNDFPTLLHNSSSIEEMLHIPPQKSYTNNSDVKFGLIWFWKTYGKRRLLGHTGSVPGITTAMVTNEKRDIGLIILTNGDVTREDAQAKQVLNTAWELINELFDCFEKKYGNGGLSIRAYFINFLGLLSIFCLLNYHIQNIE